MGAHTPAKFQVSFYLFIPFFFVFYYFSLYVTHAILMHVARFQQFGVLVSAPEAWFDISGRIKALSLSPRTEYAAFLLFKMVYATPTEVHYHPWVLGYLVITLPDSSSVRTIDVCLLKNLQQHSCVRRSDGWLEFELVGFFDLGLEDDQVQIIKVTDTRPNSNWKHGFILEGIEIRPKHVY